MESLVLNHYQLFLSQTLLFFCVFFCFLYHLQACCNSSWIYGIRDPLNQFWYGKSEVDCQIHPNLLLRSNFSCLYIKLFYCLNGNYLQFCCTSCNQSISIFSQPLARFATNFSFDYFVNYLMFNRLLRSLSISETYPCFTIQPFIFCLIFIKVSLVFTKCFMIKNYCRTHFWFPTWFKDICKEGPPSNMNSWSMSNKNCTSPFLPYRVGPTRIYF